MGHRSPGAGKALTEIAAFFLQVVKAGVEHIARMVFIEYFVSVISIFGRVFLAHVPRFKQRPEKHHCLRFLGESFRFRRCGSKRELMSACLQQLASLL